MQSDLDENINYTHDSDKIQSCTQRIHLMGQTSEDFTIAKLNNPNRKQWQYVHERGNKLKLQQLKILKQVTFLKNIWKFNL